MKDIKDLSNSDAILKLSCLSKAYCKCDINSCQLSRITPVSSQVLTVFIKSEPVNITIDSGATTSFITLKFCKKFKLDISPNGQLAKLGDGCTMIASVGEIDKTFTRDKWSVRFRAIVVEKLNCDLYGGMTFMIDNDISVRPKTGEIKIHNKHTVYQTNMLMPPPQIKALELKSCTITPPKKIVFPSLSSSWSSSQPLAKVTDGSILNVILPPEFKEEEFVLVEPRQQNQNETWPPAQICKVDDGSISIQNTYGEVISIPKDVHIINIKPTESMVVSYNVSKSIPVNLSAQESSEESLKLINH